MVRERSAIIGRKHLSQPISLRPLLRLLEPSNVIDVVTALLNESSIVFSASDHTVLTPVIEASLSLITPFEWACVRAQRSASRY